MPILSSGEILSSPKNEYTIIKHLGGGGFGDVYRIEDDKNYILALKLRKIKQEVESQGESFEVCERTFEREYEIMAKDLKGCSYTPEIFEPIFDYVFQNGETTRVIAMELAEGENLYTISLKGNVSIKDAVRWTIEILKALEWIHNKNIVWRDAKLENVILTPQGKIKILDFGAATKKKSASMRRTTVAPLTIKYSSPQAFSGKTATDPRDDIFSVGAVLAELLIGQEPEPFENPDKDIQIPPPLDINSPKMITGCLKAKNAQISDDLEQIVFKAKRFSRDDRYQTAEEMRKDLEAFLSGGIQMSKLVQAATPLFQQPSKISKAVIAFGNSGLGTCYNCGAEVYQKDRFCHTCGARIKK